MPARLKLPMIDAAAPLDAAIKRMRKAGAYAVVVDDGSGGHRILTNKDILKAKSAGRSRLGQVSASRRAVASAARPVKRSRPIDEQDAPELFGRSRARFVLTGKTAASADVVSRHERYAEMISPGPVCMYSNAECGNVMDSPPARDGHTCARCGKGKYECC